MLDETLSLSSYAYKKNTKAGRRSSKVKGANQPLIDSSSSLHQSRNLLLLQIHLSLKKMKSSSPKCIPVVSTFASPFDVTPPSSDSTRKPLSLWPGMYHSPVTIALWEARSKIFESLLDPPKDAPPQSELLTRTPSHSRTTIFYPFSTDYILREQYRDPWNEVRIGILLEDLDALAGTISVKVYICSDPIANFSSMGSLFMCFGASFVTQVCVFLMLVWLIRFCFILHCLSLG